MKSNGSLYLALQKLSEILAIKLLSIARNDCPRDPKLIDNVLLDEILYLALRDYCQRFCFDPFREIVNSNK